MGEPALRNEKFGLGEVAGGVVGGTLVDRDESLRGI